MGVVNHCPYIDSGKVDTYAGHVPGGPGVGDSHCQEQAGAQLLQGALVGRKHPLPRVRHQNKLHTHHVRRSCEY